ncbi:transcriptional regulator with XRE-family HTH domain [Paenibacillus sp. RC254]|uniref:helix-turn-helix domain-containing protein n=1 Tax=unclassified Paenibacillus TaxID=185978 RepID=UPI0024B92825|nr:MULTISPECIES: helix-turn-helix transcriptional regulator [unclassified Paenibacillus]
MAYTVIKCLLGNLLDDVEMTQAELSRRTGIHKSQISAYINMRYNKSMEIAHARRIAEALGVENPYDLYEWNNGQPSGRTDD